MNKICALVPAYNEERKIKDVIRKRKAQRVDIVVIDDGSSDLTAQIAEEDAMIVIKNGQNLGLGHSLRKGFRYALENNYELIVTLDADGQHDPDELFRFLDKIYRSGSDIVAGNRMDSPRGMPLHRWATNHVFSIIISAVSGQDINDALCGYRVFKRTVFEKISLTGEKYDIIPEILIKASKKGFIIDSVNIRSIYENERSHIRHLRDAYMFFRLIFRELKK